MSGASWGGIPYGDPCDPVSGCSAFLTGSYADYSVSGNSGSFDGLSGTMTGAADINDFDYVFPYSSLTCSPYSTAESCQSPVVSLPFTASGQVVEGYNGPPLFAFDITGTADYSLSGSATS